jgi:hypothetical protein
VIGGWTNFRNEELTNLYFLAVIIRMIKTKLTRRERCVWKRITYKIYVGKLKGKRQLGRTRYRWENNIKEGFENVDWIHVVQDRYQSRPLMKKVMNLLTN